MVIYLLGMAEILGIDLEQEIIQKVAKNKERQYKKVGEQAVDIDKENQK